MASMENVDEKEFTELRRLLPILIKNKLLTDIEAIRIASTKQLPERYLKFHKTLMTKHPQTAWTIWNMMRRVTSKIRTEENSKKHPLQNAMIAHNIFRFLSTRDVYNCRSVCQDWKTGADLFLQRKITISFWGSSSITKFCDILENSRDLLIPYNSFKFENSDTRTFHVNIRISKIEKFFEMYGENVRRLKFIKISLENPRKHLKKFDVTRWASKWLNLTHLEIDSCDGIDRFLYKGTELNVEWHKLDSIKSLSLKNVVISTQETATRISPLEITLRDVTFKRDGKFQEDDVLLNEFVDFSQTSRVFLYRKFNDKQKMTLDMSSQEFNAVKLQLVNIHLLNWTGARGNIYNFQLIGSDIVEKNNLQIQLLCTANSKIDFAALPHSIEKLHFGDLVEFTCTGIIHFPRLRFWQISNSNDFKQISHFTNCGNLTEIELGLVVASAENISLNLHLIPKSVKRIKINQTKVVILDVENDDYTFALDTLILEGYLHCLRTDVAKMIAKIRTQTLVVSGWEMRDVDTTDIIRFCSENTQLGKVIVGTVSNLDLHTNTPFETSLFMDYVDIKSNCYQFEKKVGKSITFEEFENLRKMNGSFCNKRKF